MILYIENYLLLKIGLAENAALLIECHICKRIVIYRHTNSEQATKWPICPIHLYEYVLDYGMTNSQRGSI